MLIGARVGTMQKPSSLGNVGVVSNADRRANRKSKAKNIMEWHWLIQSRVCLRKGCAR